MKKEQCATLTLYACNRVICGLRINIKINQFLLFKKYFWFLVPFFQSLLTTNIKSCHKCHSNFFEAKRPSKQGVGFITMFYFGPHLNLHWTSMQKLTWAEGQLTTCMKMTFRKMANQYSAQKLAAHVCKNKHLETPQVSLIHSRILFGFSRHILLIFSNQIAY